MGMLWKKVWALAEDPGVWITIGLGNRYPTSPPLDINSLVTNEWVAPESNRTVAGTELTRNLPNTTSGVSKASSALMWFRRPFAMATLPRGARVGAV